MTIALSKSPPFIKLFFTRGSISRTNTNVRLLAISDAKFCKLSRLANWLFSTGELKEMRVLILKSSSGKTNKLEPVASSFTSILFFIIKYSRSASCWL